MLLLLTWLLGSVPVSLVLGRAMAYADAPPAQPQPALARRPEPAAA